MKTLLSVQRVALLALALGTASTTATFAQTTTTPSTTAPTCPAGGKHQHDSVLTADEKAQLKAAREAAFAADPSLKTEHDSLKAQFETLKGEGKGGATKDQWKALKEQERAFHQKLKAAELAIDSTLAPIFAKLEAAHKDRPHSE
jgi:Spy/CpxP family protein refolding chaperone